MQKGVEACKKAKAMDADPALFPEMRSNAFRRPEKYGLLLSGEAKEPFTRSQRRK